jgi:23S rRNA (cytosine1962-C5)-methyltransferase
MSQQRIPQEDAAPVTGHRSPVTLFLRSGKDRPVRLGHPWVYSGAIRNLDPALPPGAVVRVASADGEILGVGYANPRCTIAVRMLSRRDEPIDAAFVGRRVAAALALRQRVVAADTDAYRLINGEGDGLPGVLVDRYARALVLQTLTAGAERLRPLLLAALEEQLAPRSVVERSEGAVRAAEGLAPVTAVLAGEAAEEMVHENGLRFAVLPGGGQKTGHFCDQRANRQRIRQLADGAQVLDAFAYHGGFAVHAGAGGAARVVAVDSSGAAVAAAERQWALNHLPPQRATFVAADVGRFLRDSDETFDLLVIDPPALVKQRKDVNRGARAYKDLNLWAMRRARRGALLCTFTCSQHVDAELFRKIVAGAAADAGRAVALLAHLGPGPDHPVALGHPEGEYLHGLLLRVA